MMNGQVGAFGKLGAGLRMLGQDARERMRPIPAMQESA